MKITFEWAAAQVKCQVTSREDRIGMNSYTTCVLLYTKTENGWWVKLSNTNEFVEVLDTDHTWKPETALNKFLSDGMIAVKIPHGWLVRFHKKDNPIGPGFLQIVTALPISTIEEKK